MSPEAILGELTKARKRLHAENRADVYSILVRAEII